MSKARRLELHELLVTVLGSRNVYFQPPSTIKMQYPCIVYSRAGMDTTHANNQPYTIRERFEVTVIDPNPASVIPYAISQLPMTRFNRQYTADNLNHSVFIIY